MPSHRPSVQELRELISTPSSSCQSATATASTSPSNLTADQRSKVDDLIAYFDSDEYRVLKEVKGKAFTYVPVGKDDEEWHGETWRLRDDEKIFLVSLFSSWHDEVVRVFPWMGLTL